MSNPEIPNWSFWEVLFGTFLIFLDLFILCFFAALLHELRLFLFGGEK